MSITIQELTEKIKNRKRAGGSAPIDNKTFGTIVVGLVMNKSYKEIAEASKATANTVMKVCKMVKANDKTTVARITELAIDSKLDELKKTLYPNG